MKIKAKRKSTLFNGYYVTVECDGWQDTVAINRDGAVDYLASRYVGDPENMNPDEGCDVDIDFIYREAFGDEDE